MTVLPPPEDPLPSSVSQTNQSGHNINVTGQGNYVAGGSIYITYTGPIEQLPVYPSTSTPERVYIPQSLPGSKSRTQADRIETERRTQLMDNVYYTWIVGVLERNLKAGDLVIEKDLQAEAVLTDVHFKDYRLAPDASIGHVFHEMGGQLLILGNPGSGKTMMLLQLLKDLLVDAQHDATQPIPIMLNLSSWSPDEKSLEGWLSDEMQRLYDISKKLALKWLDYGRFTLLLDGLDEVAEKDGRARPREACVEALNRYHQDHQGVQLVICSRIIDYEALQEKLKLNGAITLRTLTHEKIMDYLRGPGTEGVRDLINAEASAYEMAKTPFLLNIMKTTYAHIAYSGSPVRQLKLDQSTEKNRRNHLFGLYVDTRIKNAGAYSPQNTLHYIKWLAYQMTRRNISVFYIEDLQPDMLSQTRGLKVTGVVLGMILGTILGISVCLSIALFGGPFYGGLSNGILNGVVVGVTSGVVFGLLVAFVGTEEKIQLVEKMTFSFRQIKWWSLLLWLGLGLVLGVVLGVMGMIVQAVGSGLPSLPMRLQEAWMAIGLVIGLAFGLSIGVSDQIRKTEDVGRRQHPGTGLRASITNGMILGLVLGLILGLIGWRVGGILFGVVLGVVGMLVFGNSETIMRHIVLRYLLAHEGKIPPIQHVSITGGYDIFLDRANDIGLLRKVGGGYIFRHRMLLEYLASQYRDL